MLRNKLFLIVTAVLLLISACFAQAEEGSETTIAYEDLPEMHRALYEQSMASALADAQKRIPGEAQLRAMARGDFSGYTDTKSDNSLVVEYRVSDSVVKVGEKIKFYLNVSCAYPPMICTVGGLVLDENFDRIGDLNKDGSSTKVEDTFKAFVKSYTPTRPGYVNFVFTVTDGNGNKVSLVTSTVMVCEEDDPIFKNQSVEVNTETQGNLGLMMSLDRSRLSVGTQITANVDITTAKDPVNYRGTWTLTDAEGNILDASESVAEVNAKAEMAKIAFEYRPLKAGKLQFVITAVDGDDNRIKTNTPIIEVADGYYLTARLNRVSALPIGASVTAIYNIYGHECDQAAYFIGWECYDADGNKLSTHTEMISERSGKVSYTPRVGQRLEFYVGATCEHIKGALPETADIALVGGLAGEVSLTKSTVKYGDSIGVTYAFEGGMEPYQNVVVKGYSCDTSKGKTYCFLEKTLTAPDGTVTGSPKLGNEVYFTVEIVEADGNTSTWTTGKAALTGAPAVTELKLDASLSASKVTLGETVKLTYKMSGGSGTIGGSAPEANCIKWLRLDGTVLHTEYLTKVSASPSFKPEATGTYYCQVVLTDGYHQQITWKSDVFTVVPARPGDADGNGKVDAYDVLLTMQYCSGWPASLSKVNADADGDGAVTMADAVKILQIIQGAD